MQIQLKAENILKITKKVIIYSLPKKIKNYKNRNNLRNTLFVITNLVETMKVCKKAFFSQKAFTQFFVKPIAQSKGQVCNLSIY